MMSGSALAMLRAIQEQALTETVRVERLVEAFDPVTGLMETTPVLVWAGRASVLHKAETVVDSAGRLVVNAQTQVNLPVEGTDVVGAGYQVTVESSDTVPGLAGLVVELEGGNLGGWRTLRRFNAKVVSHVD